MKATVAVFHTEISYGFSGRGKRKFLSQKDAQPAPRAFLERTRIKLVQFFPLASRLSSSKWKKGLFLNAAAIHVEMRLTVPSTLALTLGRHTLAGTIAVQ